MDCPSCGAAVPEGRFCIACGAALAHRCPTCEATNPPGARFCAECGASLKAPAAADEPEPRSAERRQLTVLFCDLVGSTELAARLDPEDLGAIIRAYQGCCAKVVERWGGHVAKYMGDGVLAYFGWPQAHEDDPERAVRAGLDLVSAIGEQAVSDQARLAVRIGIATGQVVVGELIGEGAAQEETVVGATPNLAARLQGLAAPGTVVVAPGTRRLVGDLFELADLGPRQLKGYAEPLTAFRVVGESRVEGRFEALHGRRLTPLVGREHELGVLLERWERVKQGEGQVILLSGEPGIGKSRIVRGLRERLAGQAYTPLGHYCSPYHANSTLYPVIGLLERAAGFERDDPPAVRLAKLEALLALGSERLREVLPLIAGLLEVPVGESYPPVNLAPQVRLQRTLEILVDQVTGLAARQPVLATYEDVHWIDPTTLEALGFLVERAQRSSVLVLITYRPEFIPPWSGHAHVMQLSLTRLTRGHGAAMVARLAGGSALPAEVLDQILARTDGVPLFVEELTKAVLESGLLRAAGDRYELSGALPPLAIPATLHDSLMARLDRLAPVKEVAQTAAVIGREFSHELLAAVSTLPDHRLRAALDQLVSSELVYRRGGPRDATYSFKHALVQDAAYQSLLRPRRQELHLRIVRALRDHFPAVVQTLPEIAAQHYTAAGLLDEAIPYWQLAGQRAGERFAHVEAIRHFAKGLELLGSLPATAERVLQELDLQTRLGSTLMTTKGYAAPETQQAYARARALCHEVGEVPQLFPVLRGLWILHTVRAEFRTAQELGEHCLRLARSLDDRTLLPEAHFALGGTQLWLGELIPALQNMEQGFALYDRDQHRPMVALYGQDPGMACLCYGAWALWLLGYPDQALQRVEQAVRLTREMSHPYSLVVAQSFAARVHQLRRESGAVLDQAAAAVDLATEQGYAYWIAQGRLLQGWALAARGVDEEAASRMRQALADLASMEAELLRPYLLALFAEVHRQSGRIDQGLRLLAEALSLVDKTGERWWQAELYRQRGELMLQQGASTRAEACLEQALQLSRRQQAKSLELRAATSLAQLWAERGERPRARDLLAPVHGWFTEGSLTLDLAEAKALLDELG